MTRPRILHVYKDYFPPTIGGIENTINLMARGTKDEFDVTVLVCSGSSHAIEEEIDGVRVVRVPELFRMMSAPFSLGFAATLKHEAAAADILHFHHPNPTGDVTYFMAKPQAPVVMTYHSDVVRQKFAMFAYGPIQERMMSACKVIMPTSINYQESSPWLDRHRAVCRVLPLGIDLTRFVRTPELTARAAEIRAEYVGGLVLFVGRLRYYKGLEFLIDAIRQLDATLVMVGSGPDFQRLREIANIRNVLPRSKFAGELSEFELLAHLFASDVFCLPSHQRSEAFGLSMVEAMASGLPVVCTNMPTGVSFVNQDGVTGYTVHPASGDALARAIGKLLENDSLRKTMGEAARVRAHSLFSAEKMCSDLKDVYRGVLDVS